MLLRQREGEGREQEVRKRTDFDPLAVESDGE